jgi:hypothetical protein
MDDTDDYLSDTFLTIPGTSNDTLSYIDKRRQAQRESELRNIQNRKRSRKELEESTRQEGLAKSLFEREQELRGASVASTAGSKAMNMMFKMGFQVGQSLGKVETTTSAVSSAVSPTTHRTEPIPIHIWSGAIYNRIRSILDLNRVYR